MYICIPTKKKHKREQSGNKSKNIPYRLEYLVSGLLQATVLENAINAWALTKFSSTESISS